MHLVSRKCVSLTTNTSRMGLSVPSLNREITKQEPSIVLEDDHPAKIKYYTTES